MKIWELQIPIRLYAMTDVLFSESVQTTEQVQGAEQLYPLFLFHQQINHKSPMVHFYFSSCLILQLSIFPSVWQPARLFQEIQNKDIHVSFIDFSFLIMSAKKRFHLYLIFLPDTLQICKLLKI